MIRSIIRGAGTLGVITSYSIHYTKLYEVGLHYFNPVEKMPLVEVIPHSHTDPVVVATVLALARAQGKTPVVVQDISGFYVNRILASYNFV